MINRKISQHFFSSNLPKVLSIFLTTLLLSTSAVAKEETKSPHTHLADEQELITDIIGVSESQLSPSFWIDKLPDKQSLLMSKQQITDLNQKLFASNPHIFNQLQMAEQLSSNELLAKISQISRQASSARFYENGKQLSSQDYDGYANNLNISAVKTSNRVQFALVTKRSSLRTFPTFDRVFKKNDAGIWDKDLDLFQESGIFPGEVVAVLHESTDKQWLLVQSYNYLAWMPKADVAIGNKAQITAFKEDDKFITVTGSKVFTNHVPSYVKNHKQLSNIQLDMGVSLPLAKRSDYSNEVYGQNPYTNYIVKFPTKNKQGKLKIDLAAISKNQDVHVGFLALTQANLIKQAFKFLGERYGWGHDFNGRDCTGFIGEIYKSFGLLMPRNSGQQAKGNYGQNNRIASEMNKDGRINELSKLKFGDLIYIPGHVMMYIGTDNDQPYVIHDVKDYSYITKTGEEYLGTLNGVAVTPLLPLKDYVNNITVIKSIGKRISKDVSGAEIK